MPRLLAAAIAAALLCTTPAVEAKSKSKADRNSLLRVIAPQSRTTASAHPFVNVVIRFGTTSTGTGADPSSFRAHIGSNDVTDRFVDETDNGKVIGKRAKLDEPLVHPGRRNRLRLSVRSMPSGKKRGFTDRDLVKFKVERRDNQPPPAAINPVDCFVGGITTQFAAGTAPDPEQDEVTYTWDFGDGGTATGMTASHTYDETDVVRTVTLTANDGQTTSTATLQLQPVPPCDDGALPGRIAVDADAALEFTGVAPGASAQRTFTVTNSDATPGSQVKARVCSEAAAFTIEPRDVTLGPGESMPITVTFHPSAEGHESARVALGACAMNTPAVAFLAHGYGGTSTTSGPTLAPDPVYYQGILPGAPRFGILRIQPDGQRTVVDNTAHRCVLGDGSGSGDLCFVDGDCRQAGEHCVDPAPGTLAFDPSDFCGDSDGNLYILSEDTVLGNGDLDEQTGSIVRIRMNDQGQRTGADVLTRIATQSTQIGCDRDAPSKGGLVYLAEYHALPEPSQVCARDSQEQLVAIRKSNGARISTGVDRIDAVEINPPLDPCDDEYDPSDDINVSADGTAAYTSQDNGGIYRMRPSPLPILLPTYQVRPNPDEVPTFSTDHFNVHPDGALMYPVAIDVGTTGTINLYKIYPEQAESGPLAVEDLTPCATYTLPDNRSSDQISFHRRGTVVFSFATTRATAGSDDGITLVSFATLGDAGGAGALGSKLRVQGTVAFTSAAGSSQCSVAGLVNLELLDSLSF